jgi:acyl carrier protein
MDQKSIDNRIKKVMSKVFGLDINSITDDASPDTIEQWDSLRHMNLILAIEEEFNIELTEEQAVEILNYKLIESVLKEHGVYV